MSKPFFSVVIPCFNSESYIRETLESINSQTFREFEIVLIDDHSTDNSLKVACQYFKEYDIKGICEVRDSQKYPKGVSGCRNQGVDFSKGEWICFLDSDDLFHPEKLKILFDQINRKYHSEVKAIYHTPLDFIDGHSFSYEVYDIPKIVSYFGDISNELLSKNLIYTSAVCVHRSVFDHFQFDYGLHGIEDYYLWLNVSKISPWLYIEASLTAYRIRQSSLMGGRRMEYYITQNFNLIKKIRNNKLFTPSEVSIVEQYLMVNIMNYYATISLKRFGWSDFVKGVIFLIGKGYLKGPISLFLKHSRFKILSFLSKMLKVK